MVTNGFQKAVREKIAAKIMLGGVAGCGKTYSALRLATGIAKKVGGKIAFIDTEGDRGSYYADKFNYDILSLTDHSPEAYVQAIKMAEDAGYQVCIIDSTSHEWDYCLEVHGKMPGNSYTNWAKITPRHDKFMEAIIQSPMYIICTTRGKVKYVLEDKNGKQVPKKAGMGIKQRDDVDYEFTIFFDIEQDTHIASASKDNTGIFDGKFDVITEAHGVAIYNWANSGAEKKVVDKPKMVAPTTLDSIIGDIGEIVQSLMSDGHTGAELGSISAEISGTKNFKSIKDIEVAKQLLEAYQNIK